jgi:hypothetical protein
VLTKPISIFLIAAAFRPFAINRSDANSVS